MLLDGRLFGAIKLTILGQKTKKVELNRVSIISAFCETRYRVSFSAWHERAKNDSDPSSL